MSPNCLTLAAGPEESWSPLEDGTDGVVAFLVAESEGGVLISVV